MKYNFDRVVDRRGTNSGKWEFTALINPKADADTIPLWIADMDFPCAVPIQKALKDRVDREIFGYSAHFTGEYFRAVCSWMQRRFNWYVHSEDIFITAGVVPAISSLVKCFSSEGDGVIIQRPVYGPFTQSIENNKRKVVDNALINNNGYYTMDFDDLEVKAKDPNNKIMILCSPHNPVGRVWTKEELRKVGEICLANNVVLVSDEIHFDLIRKGITHTVLETLFPNEDRIITCTAPSKTFNLAGLHTSHIVIKNKQYKEKWNEVVGMKLLSPLSIWAVQAAYDMSEDWLDQVNEYIDENMRFVKSFLEKHLPKAQFVIPEGTYLAWINLEGYGIGGEELDNLLVEDAKVLLEGGHMFSPEALYYQRINVACPRSILKEALTRIANSLNKLRLGDKLRNFTFATPWQKELQFNEVVNKNTFLIFLRYYGCTFCQVDMAELAERYQEFTNKDAQVFVVLQSNSKTISDQINEKDLPFTIICDPHQKLYQLYNLNTAFSTMGMLAEDVLAKGMKAMQMGLAHGKYEGNELQLPAAFLFNNKGQATYIHYGKTPADVPTVDELVKNL